ncbi:MAG: hypothetical protein AB8B64_11165 [Granulosicoccus sp.]
MKSPSPFSSLSPVANSVQSEIQHVFSRAAISRAARPARNSLRTTRLVKEFGVS